jgi:hypothetical protein
MGAPWPRHRVALELCRERCRAEAGHVEAGTLEVDREFACSDGVEFGVLEVDQVELALCGF